MEAGGRGAPLPGLVSRGVVFRLWSSSGLKIEASTPELGCWGTVPYRRCIWKVIVVMGVERPPDAGGVQRMPGFLSSFLRFLKVSVFYQKKVVIVDLEISGKITRKTFRNEQ